MLNKKTQKEQTALMVAVARQHTSCVRLLLERGADPDIVNDDRETALTKGTKPQFVLQLAGDDGIILPNN